MIRATIIVEGEVQKVGYRDLVQSLARGLGVKGYVENLKDGTVKVVCEAEEEVLERFLREIDVKQGFINVKGVNLIETTKATGEFPYFEIRYGPLEEELGERMGTAIRYAGAMWQDLKEMHVDLKAETSGIKESIKEMHKDLKDEIAGIRESIKEMHTNVDESFNEMAVRYDSISAELLRTREELIRAVDKLSNLINEFIRRGVKS